MRMRMRMIMMALHLPTDLELVLRFEHLNDADTLTVIYLYTIH